MIAQDDTFCKEVQAIAEFVDHPELDIPAETLGALPPAVRSMLPTFRQQPSFQAVGKLMEIFRGRGVTLSVYEACEINRWLYEDKEKNPPAGGMRQLREYWKGLGDFATSRKGDAEFEALAGALAVDPHFRFDFVKEQADVTEIGFRLQPEEEAALRDLLQTDGDADLAAKRFEAESWSGSCLQIARPYDGWFHINA